MSLSMLTTREAVLEAMREYDALGASEFLKKYGFGMAISYRVLHEGRSYDSKAIAGVAVGKEHPDHGPMNSADFSGGENVQQKLISLGFTFATDQAGSSANGFGPDRAMEIISDRWGEPKSSQKKSATWSSPEGRQLVLTREGVSVRVWTELAPPTASGRSTIEYGSKRSRSSSLKSNAPRLAEPFVSYFTTVDHEAALDDLLDWYGAQSSTGLDPQGLLRLKSAFLRAMPDFTSFAHPGQIFEEQERSYKVELVRLFAKQVAPLVEKATAPTIAAELWQAFWSLFKAPLTSEGGKPQNLIDWRAFTRLKPTEDARDEELGLGLRDLLVGPGDQFERLTRFIPIIADRVKPLGSTSPSDDGRSIGSFALMLQDPENSIIVRYGLYDRAMQELRRARLPSVDAPKVERYREALKLTLELKQHMEANWGWAPRDLIDVQSFIHVALTAEAETVDSLGLRLGQFIERFAAVREDSFRRDEPLWEAAEAFCARLRSMQPIRRRPDMEVSWSVGKGVWTSVPWFALMNRNVTRTTQEGIYGVLLVSQDLSRIYLVLGHGITKIVEDLGQAAAVEALSEQSTTLRKLIPELTKSGFSFEGRLDLGASGWRAKSYEVSAIASREYLVAEFPGDNEFEVQLEALLAAHDKVVAQELSEIGAEEVVAYTVDDAMAGLFMERTEFERMLSVWRGKKNLILQGAPGVGKSFVARRLAYALMEEKADSRIEAVQFHQSYGYEDFVQGYRPTEQGGFDLRNGTFFRFCRRAVEEPESAFVIIIDEINRGNLSKILGELMLLIETDKRSSIWGTRLAYARPEEPPFWVPENLYILGMMNTADRSLSLVDYALRRRFAFVSLKPAFSSPAFAEHLEANGVERGAITHIVQRMTELNATIAQDTLNLGPGFCIGHSFFVPSSSVGSAEHWLETIVDTEICPLLDEYWPDDPDRSAEWRSRLLG